MESFIFSLKRSYFFLLPALLLAIFGLMALLSLSTEAFTRQLVFLILGGLVFLFFARLPRDLALPASVALLVIFYLLLLASLLWGGAVRGSARWLRFGFFSIQPSELIKPFLAVVLARVFSPPQWRWRRFFLSGAIALPAIALTLAQPDLGTSLVLVVLWATVAVFSGIRPLAGVLLGALGVASASLGFLFGLKPYQQTRLRSFLNPEADPLGAGYNVLQAKIAIGSGRLLGKGFGQGSQSHLNFLPESKTDFIFASLAEEWGFVGTSLLLVLFLLLSLGLLKVGATTGNKGDRLLFLGIWAILTFQVVVNMGMNLGVAPVTGIPLPFVSLGGSSQIAFWAGLGILTSVQTYDILSAL